MVVTAGQAQLMRGDGSRCAWSSSARRGGTGRAPASGAVARPRRGRRPEQESGRCDCPKSRSAGRCFATVLSLLLVLVGLVSFTRLSVREYPQIDEPVVTVTRG